MSRGHRPPAGALSVLGVDPGTREAALVALDRSGRLLFRQHLALRGDDLLPRLLHLYNAVDAALARSRAAILAIENPAHPRNPHTAHVLGCAAGVSMLAAARRGLVVLAYRPAQLRAVRPDVLRRYRSAHRWTPDELAAACAALRALAEPVQVSR